MYTAQHSANMCNPTVNTTPAAQLNNRSVDKSIQNDYKKKEENMQASIT